MKQMNEMDADIRRLRTIYRWRGKLVALPLVVALFCTWRENENHLSLWIVTAALFAVGLGIRLWSQQHIHYRLKISGHVTMTGPYALVRNPIYIGNTIICLALTIGSELLWMLPATFIVCCIVYGLTVKYEELNLPEQFGQPYLDYVQRVPRWLPRFPKTPAPLTFVNEHLGKSLVAEAHTLIFLAAVAAKELITW